MKVFRIHQGKALPLPVRILCVTLVVVATTQVLLWLPKPYSMVISIATCTLLPAAWFANKLLIIDEEKKTVFKGIWTMGKRFGDTINYEASPTIWIEKKKTKKTAYQLSNKETILVNAEYRAYLRLDDGRNIFLISHPIEKRLNEKVERIKNKLQLN